MVNVLLERNKSGEFVSCLAEGHAGYALKGFDIVCSAVSVLIKTVLAVLENTEGINLEEDTSCRGKVFFKIVQRPEDFELQKKLVFAMDFLEEGFSSVSKEYPENVLIKVITV